MTQKGIVTDIDDHYVYVTVRQTTACDGCHKRDVCPESSHPGSCASTLCVKAHNDCGASVGDEVEIETSASRVLLYAFVVFILPFAPAFAAYFLVKNAADNEFLAIAAAVTALAVFFLFLRLTLDRQSEKRCDRRASRIIRSDRGDPVNPGVPGDHIDTGDTGDHSNTGDTGDHKIDP